MDLSLVMFGNLCIAGHNYENNLFFSNLHKLSEGEKIVIEDIFGNTFNYIIYAIYESSPYDVSSTSQDTNNKVELTLVTCNNLNGNRLIIKSKSI